LTRAEAIGRVLARTEAARREAAQELFAARETSKLARALLEEAASQRKGLERELTEARVNCDRACAEANLLRKRVEELGSSPSPVHLKTPPPLPLGTLAETPSPLWPETPALPSVREEREETRTQAEGDEDFPTARLRTGRRSLPSSVLQTPRTWRGVLSGSVAQIVWQEGDGGVESLAFLRRTTGVLHSYGSDGLCEGGPLPLRRGEYLVSISGKTGVSPCIATWFTMETSEGQSITVGNSDSGFGEDFAFKAGKGREIVGIRFSVDTGFTGIIEEALPPSRRDLAGRGDVTPGRHNDFGSGLGSSPVPVH
jgi:hypothetical protein